MANKYCAAVPDKQERSQVQLLRIARCFTLAPRSLNAGAPMPAGRRADACCTRMALEASFVAADRRTARVAFKDSTNRV